MLIVLGVILVAIAVVFIYYIFTRPVENEKDIKKAKLIGYTGSIGLMLLAIGLIFNKIRK